MEISLGYFVAKAGYKCEYLKEMCHLWTLGIYKGPNRNGIYIIAIRNKDPLIQQAWLIKRIKST